jgi:hypothetical protein
MLEYFPTNYVWNLSTNIALLMGGNVGEVDTICRKLIEVSKIGDDSGTVAFFEAWCEQADRLVELAREDAAAGRRRGAGAKYGRAATYYITAERMQNRHFEPRKQAFGRMMECFAKYIELGAQNCERVEIPYRGKTLAGLFVRADRQIPREYALQQYDRAINSPKRELKWFTPREGGVEHVSADNPENAKDYIADWIAGTFLELGAQGVSL